MLFENKESCQPSGIKEIKRYPKFAHAPQRHAPSVPQVRRGLERPIIPRVIKSRQLGCILRTVVGRQIILRRVIAMRQREASVPVLDRDLPDATQARCQPIPKRAFLRESAHFNARAIRNAVCSRKSRSSSVNAFSFSLSTSIRPTTFPDSVITGTTISEFVLPKVGK